MFLFTLTDLLCVERINAICFAYYKTDKMDIDQIFSPKLMSTIPYPKENAKYSSRKSTFK